MSSACSINLHSSTYIVNSAGLSLQTSIISKAAYVYRNVRQNPFAVKQAPLKTRFLKLQTDSKMFSTIEFLLANNGLFDWTLLGCRHVVVRMVWVRLTFRMFEIFSSELEGTVTKNHCSWLAAKRSKHDIHLTFPFLRNVRKGGLYNEQTHCVCLSR